MLRVSTTVNRIYFRVYYGMEDAVYAQCEEAWPEIIITAEVNEDDLSKLRTTYTKNTILTYINVTR